MYVSKHSCKGREDHFSFVTLSPVPFYSAYALIQPRLVVDTVVPKAGMFLTGWFILQKLELFDVMRNTPISRKITKHHFRRCMKSLDFSVVSRSIISMLCCLELSVVSSCFISTVSTICYFPYCGLDKLLAT